MIRVYSSDSGAQLDIRIKLFVRRRHEELLIVRIVYGSTIAYNYEVQRIHNGESTHLPPSASGHLSHRYSIYQFHFRHI
jgi:hypothetical protein